MTGVERIADLFARSRGEQRAALLPYLMAGIPDAAASAALFGAMAAAGADGFEIGVPYADPLMDGPTIQEAGWRALAHGMTVAGAFDIVEEVTALTGRVAMVMSYVNPILRLGPDRFAARAAAAGASGLIVADLPVDEAGPIAAAARTHGLGLALFVAPTTDDARLDAVAASGPAFIYGVAELGVTGERTESGGRLAELAARVRAVTDIPLVLGVGISTPQQAAYAAQFADGIIVGSALVRRVLDAPTGAVATAALAEAVAALAEAVRRDARLG